MSKKRFTVGQQVVRVRRAGYSDSPAPTFEPAFVSKVGTKWVTVHGRDPRYVEQYNGMTGKGVTYRGDREINQIWESREAWELHQQQRAERKSFLQEIDSYSYRDVLELVPIEDIRAAAKLLGIKLEKGR